MIAAWFNIVLWKRILGALIVGALYGMIAGEAVVYTSWIGNIFINLIQMLVIPLIFVTLTNGVVSMGSPARLQSMGLKTFGLFLLTTFSAVSIGMTLGLIFQPGSGVDFADVTARSFQSSMTLSERLSLIIPKNPFSAFANGNTLAIIVFSIFLGVGILLAGEAGKPIASIFKSGVDVLLRIVGLIMEIAPFGVFALVADVTGSGGLSLLFKAFELGALVAVGLLIQMFLVHGSIMRFVLRLPAKRFFVGIADAQMVALSTTSSAATLPVSLSVSEQNLGVPNAVGSVVLPLGATVNMDGTGVFVTVVALFSAQAFGIDLSLADYFVIALTTMLISIGTATAPSASLFLLAIVLEPIGVSPEQTAIIVGFLFPFDRPLDMLRTATNVTGDLSVSVILAKAENVLDADTFRQKAVE